MKPCKECVYYQIECVGDEIEHVAKKKNIEDFDVDCFMSQERAIEIDQLLEEANEMLKDLEGF